MDVAKLRVLIEGDDTGLQKIGDGAKKAAFPLSSLGNIAQSALGVFAGGLMTKATEAIAGFVQEGIKGFGDLQQQVANISTIKPEINTKGVFDALNLMQTRVPQTAAQLGESLYDVFSSVNVTQKDGLRLVEQFARGAVGAQTDAKTFGTSIMGVMNAYKLSVKDAAHTSDLFFNTVKAGVVTGPELAASLGPVTQASKAFGQSQETLFAAIAAVTKEGGPAAQNINNLNNVMQKMTGKEAIKGFKDLGVEVSQNGKFRDLSAILGDLKKKLDPLPPAIQAAKLNSIFPDAQARQGIQTLLSQFGFFNQTLKDNKTQAGAAADAYAKMSATFQSQSALLKNSFNAIATAVGAELLPKMTPLIGVLAKDLPQAIGKVGPFLKQIEASFRTVFAPIMPMVRDVAAFVVQQFSVVRAWFTQNMPLIRQTVATVLGAIAEFWKHHGEQIKSIIGSALKIVLGVIKLAMQVITGDWSGAGRTIISIIKNLWDMVRNLFAGGLDFLNSLKNRLAGAMNAIGQAIWQGIVNGIKSGVGAVGEAARGLAQGAVDAAKGALAIRSPSRVMFAIGAFVVRGFVEGIIGNIPAAEAAADLLARAFSERSRLSVAEATKSARHDLLTALYGDNSAQVLQFDQAMRPEDARAAAIQIADLTRRTQALNAQKEFRKAVGAVVVGQVQGAQETRQWARDYAVGGLASLPAGGAAAGWDERTRRLTPLPGHMIARGPSPASQRAALLDPLLNNLGTDAQGAGRRFLETILGGGHGSRQEAIRGLLADIQKSAVWFTSGLIMDGFRPAMQGALRGLFGDLKGGLGDITRTLGTSIYGLIAATYGLMAVSQRKKKFGLGSVLGGIAGFALGGPGGAVAGYNVGNAVDNGDYRGALLGGVTGYLGGSFKGGSANPVSAKGGTSRAANVNVNVYGGVNNAADIDRLRNEISGGVQSGLRLQAG